MSRIIPKQIMVALSDYLMDVDFTSCFLVMILSLSGFSSNQLFTVLHQCLFLKFV